MDLVSFETREEYEWVKGFINGKNCVVMTGAVPSNFLHFSECTLLLDLWTSV